MKRLLMISMLFSIALVFSCTKKEVPVVSDSCNVQFSFYELKKQISDAKAIGAYDKNKTIEQYAAEQTAKGLIKPMSKDLPTWGRRYVVCHNPACAMYGDAFYYNQCCTCSGAISLAGPCWLCGQYGWCSYDGPCDGGNL